MWASSICLAMAPTFQSPQLWGLDHCLTQECPASENMDLLLLTEVSFIFLFCLVKTCLWGKARLRHCARVHACSVISVVSNSSQPYGLWPARLLCPWDSPGKNTIVGCHFLLQGIFPTQGLNLLLLQCKQILYWLNQQGSPVVSLLLGKVVSYFRGI